jgi:hypothetical protein
LHGTGQTGRCFAECGEWLSTACRELSRGKKGRRE